MVILQQGQGLIGIALILTLAWALSEDRAARPSWRWIFGALFVQIALALAVTRVPFIWTLVGYANNAVAAVEKATLVGSSYMFGYTGGAPIPFVLKPGVEQPVIVAFQILPLIIVFSALSALVVALGHIARGGPWPVLGIAQNLRGQRRRWAGRRRDHVSGRCRIPACPAGVV